MTWRPPTHCPLCGFRCEKPEMGGSGIDDPELLDCPVHGRVSVEVDDHEDDRNPAAEVRHEAEALVEAGRVEE